MKTSFRYLFILLMLLSGMGYPSSAQQLVRRPVTHAARMIPTENWKSVAVSDLPVSVDNSRSEHFPPIFNQLGGSCAQASSIGYLFTYEMNRLLDRPASLKENRFSYLYTWNFINEGKDSGTFGTSGLSFAQDAGVMTEADFPKQTSPYQFCWASGYGKYYNALHYKVRKFVRISLCKEEDLPQVKQYLYNKNEPGKPGGVLVFGSATGSWQFNDDYQGPSETGYHSILKKMSDTGAHAMTIVGYDDLVEFTAPDGTLTKGAFIVANSWGHYHHDNGKYYFPYWFFLQKRGNDILENEVVGADVEHVQPQVVFKVGVSCTSRNDLSFRIGAAAKASDLYPQHDYIVGLANHQGGDYPMQGSGVSPDIELAFDFTPHLDKISGIDRPNYFLTVNKGQRGFQKGEAHMISFSVLDYRKDVEHPEVYDCPDIAGKILVDGENMFNIPTSELLKCPYSPLKWLSDDGDPVSAPLVFRTAQGRYAKARFSGYDRSSGTITLKYVYAPDGSRKFK